LNLFWLGRPSLGFHIFCHPNTYVASRPLAFSKANAYYFTCIFLFSIDFKNYVSVNSYIEKNYISFTASLQYLIGFYFYSGIVIFVCLDIDRSASLICHSFKHKISIRVEAWQLEWQSVQMTQQRMIGFLGYLLLAYTLKRKTFWNLWLMSHNIGSSLACFRQFTFIFSSPATNGFVVIEMKKEIVGFSFSHNYRNEFRKTFNLMIRISMK